MFSHVKLQRSFKLLGRGGILKQNIIYLEWKSCIFNTHLNICQIKAGNFLL